MLKVKMKTVIGCLLLTMLLSSNVCFAESVKSVPLDEIGSTSTVTQKIQTEVEGINDGQLFSENNISESNKESAKTVADLFSSAGVDEKSAEEAKRWIAPVAGIVNNVCAVLLGLLALLLLLTSVIDLVYLCIPMTRKFLAPDSQQSSGAPQSPMMGDSMNPMRMQENTSGSGSSGTRYVSDDALTALQEASPQQSSPMAMPGMPGMPTQSSDKGKSVLLTYFKKRSFTLIMLGICIILFSCTIFTDLGIVIGTKILALLSGLF